MQCAPSLPMAKRMGVALALALLAVAAGGADAAVRVCGQKNITETEQQQVQRDLNATMVALVGTTNQTLAGERLAANARTATGANDRATALPATGINVPVYVHIVLVGSTAAKGNVSDATVAAQIAQLNSAYAQTGATFTLAATTRTNNASWYSVAQDSQEWIDMTNALHQGGVGDLNLYLLALAYPLLGWSEFPWWYAGAPLQDGVFVSQGSLPGGNLSGFNLGNTAVHEIGHWLMSAPSSLCAPAPGDYVADTDYEAMPEYYCESGPTKTCPQAGAGVFQLYMDYPPDACMTTFTMGQATRLVINYNTYRTGGPAYSPGGAPVAPTAENATSAPSRTIGPPAPLPASCADSAMYRAPGGCERCVSSLKPFTKNYAGYSCVQPTTLSAESTACTNLILPIAIRNNANTKETVSCVNPASATASLYLPLKTAAATFITATSNYNKKSIRLGSLRSIRPKVTSAGDVIFSTVTVNGSKKMLLQFPDSFGVIRSAAGTSIPLSGVLNRGGTLLPQCFTAYVKVCAA